MKKKISILLIAALIIGGYLFFNFQTEKVQVEVGINPGMKAANFELTTLAGKTLSLNDFEGKKVLINFWASWCPPCREEMPDLQKLHTNNGEQLVILAVNIGESSSAAANFMEKNNFDFTVLLDKDQATARDYLVRGVPTSYFLDEKGIITDRIVGVLSYQKMIELADIESSN